MAKIKILLVQNAPIIKQKAQNLSNIDKMLEPLNNEHFDLVIFPELFAVGWHPDSFIENAETLNNSPTLNLLSSVAKRFNSNVIGGSYILRENDGTLRNACPIINRNGEILDHYYKIHLFSHFLYNEGRDLTSGDKGLLVNLDIGKIGISICYDIRFPELFRAYSYQDADLLVEVAAWPKYRQNHWETLTKARAIENQSFMISVSQSGHIMDEEWNIGKSMVVAPYGEVLFQAGCDACTNIIEIDLDETRKLRKEFPILKDRKALPYSVKEI